MRKPSFIFGWMYGGENSSGTRYQQYVQRRAKDTPADDVPAGHDRCKWWPTTDPAKATRFKSIDACIDYFRLIYWYTAEECESCIRGDFLQFFQDTPTGPVQVMPAPPQLSLFDNFITAPLSAPAKPVSRVDEIRAMGFSLDEAKILAAGFSLVRYPREEKRLWIALTSGPEPFSWLKTLPYRTYAEAERSLKDYLKEPLFIYVSEDGKVTGYQSINRLLAAGFDFYRSEGIIPGHGTPRIKCASKNWGNWNKYTSGSEVKTAWEELMKDEKALEG